MSWCSAQLVHYGRNCKILSEKVKKYEASFCFWTDKSINMELRILFWVQMTILNKAIWKIKTYSTNLNTKRLQSFWIIQNKKWPLWGTKKLRYLSLNRVKIRAALLVLIACWPIRPGLLAFKHCCPRSVQPYRNSINHV